jgi:hypothetical protein
MPPQVFLPVSHPVIGPNGRITEPWLAALTALAAESSGTSGSAITGLNGDGTATGPGVVPLTLAASGVTPGTYGDGSNYPVVTVDGKGRVTAASELPLPAGGITQLTGEVTAGPGSGAQAATITNGAVTNAKLADMAQALIKGRAAGAGTGAPQDLTGTQVTALLDVFTSLLQGVVPASGGGTSNFLRADGTWAVPPGGGGGGAWAPLTTGAEPIALVSDGAGACVMVAFTP